ncbi:Ig-like domain-containing protein [Phocaeicola oris]|uniref:Ig-like domain-containing protein n=1 Tax=Phocaeicola oris TaxID=2896850 RepID=UPI00234EB1B2|nr:Ig-like domain-containing protein [Phocaeicola oris]MCE2617273.1 Ig-like domain-containing protein [Phocaeicola oris]
MASSNFDNFKFIVNVNTGCSTRAATDKSDWNVGDKIVMSIDGDENNICNLQYEGNGLWKVTKQDDSTTFSKDEGALTAVHADNLVYNSGNTITEGDVLYTKEGSYKKYNNAVEINLTMNQRPVSRFAVIGMAKGYWLDGLTTFNRLESLSTVSWKKNQKSNADAYKEIYGDTCVYYGVLESTQANNTTVTLVNANGSTYTRTYSGKQTKAGDYVVINGPKTSEADSWKHYIRVIDINAKKESLTMVKGESGSIKDLYTITPADPTNSKVTAVSSNPHVVKISNDGTYTAVAKGNATITITSEDGHHVCAIHVKVVNDLSELITVRLQWNGNNSASITPWGSNYAAGVDWFVTNNSSKEIIITSIEVFNSSAGYSMGTLIDYQLTVAADGGSVSGSFDVTSKLSISTILPRLKIVYKVGDKTYEKSY